MFLGAYIGFLFSGILLWFITIRVTRDEEGLDWWDCALWVAGAYVAALAVHILTSWIHLPGAIQLVLEILAGLAVLDWFLRGQFGKTKAFEIIAIFIGIRILFALPWIAMWVVSVYDTNP
jgi:hypothetical protein